MTMNLPQTVSSTMMPNQEEFQMLQVIAKNAQDSGLYGGVGQQAKIFMVLLAARELGVSPMLALNGGIWNIQGKIEISARLMNALIRRAGHSIKIVVSNETECKLLGTRTDGDSYEASFTMEDATKAGLAGNNTWKKYPADMLYNRCMSRLARRLFSDVIGNSYVEGEIREAKEAEAKELQIADCEVKSSVLSLNEENKHLSDEELSKLMQGRASMNEKSVEGFDKYILEKWGVTNISFLPREAFEPLMKSIQRNLELNSKEKVDAVN